MADDDGDGDILLATFRKFDKDGSNHLDKNEMFFAMQEIMGAKVTQEMVDRVIRELDKDQSGTISLDEFYDVFEKCDNIVQAVESGGVGVSASPEAIAELASKNAQILEAIQAMQEQLRRQAEQHEESLKEVKEMCKSNHEELSGRLQGVEAMVKEMKDEMSKKSSSEKKDKKEKKEKKADDGEQLE